MKTFTKYVSAEKEWMLHKAVFLWDDGTVELQLKNGVIDHLGTPITSIGIQQYVKNGTWKELKHKKYVSAGVEKWPKTEYVAAFEDGTFEAISHSGKVIPVKTLQAENALKQGLWKEFESVTAKPGIKYISVNGFAKESGIDHVIVHPDDTYMVTYKKGILYPKYEPAFENIKLWIKNGQWIPLDDTKKSEIAVDSVEPEYYVHAKNGFAKAAYVIGYPATEKLKVISKDGKQEKIWYWTWKQAQSFLTEGNWKKISKEEAEALVKGTEPLVKSTEPEYYVHAKNGFCALAYVIGYPATETIQVVNKDGMKDLGDSLWTWKQAQSFLTEGNWKKISKEEAEALVKYPLKFYTKTTGWLSPIAYVVTDSTDKSIFRVSLSGKKIKPSAWKYHDAAKFVETGLWKEITQNEAEALVNKKTVDATKDKPYIVKKYVAAKNTVWAADLAFCAVYSDGSTAFITNTGTVEYENHYTAQQCEQKVLNGQWKLLENVTDVTLDGFITAPVAPKKASKASGTIREYIHANRFECGTERIRLYSDGTVEVVVNASYSFPTKEITESDIKKYVSQNLWVEV